MSLLFASHFPFWDFSMFKDCKILTVKLYKDDPTIWQAQMLNILAVYFLLDQMAHKTELKKAGSMGSPEPNFFQIVRHLCPFFCQIL